jgi:uncharacterized membrane protein YphA (DoxX/SURF4 family)
MLVRLTVGGMFVYASLYKILDPGSFARSIWFYHMVPGTLINLMAIILPWIELLCGLALVFGVLYRGAVLWANLMTVIFLFALGSAIMRGLSIDCGCFKAGAQATEAAWDSFYFDLGLLVLTLQLLCSRSKRWHLARTRR